jgi:hypothetical protein
MSTMVNTKHATGRRKLRFESLDEVWADVEQLASGPYTRLGNWSLGEIADHLANALDSATDNNQYQPGWFIGLIGPLLKSRALRETLPAGFRMPAGMRPIFMPKDGATDDEGIAHLKKSIERFKVADLPPRSPTLGSMTPDEWLQFHCRHAELHLSFLIPEAR